MHDATLPSVRARAFAALLFATVAWGGLFHAGKQVLHRLDPFWFTALRYAGAAGLLVLLLVVTRQWRGSVLKAHGPRLAAYGALGYGMFGILVFVGLARSEPSHGAVIMATLPLSGFFMRWIFDGQRPAWWTWAGGLIALLGVLLVSGVATGGHDGHPGGNTLLGDGIAYVGTIGWLLYTRGQAKVAGVSVSEYTGYTAVLALPSLLVIALVATALGWAQVPAPDDVSAVLPAFAYITVVATVLAALAYNFGVRTLGATNGIVFINFVPVSALLIGMAFGQRPSGAEWLGTALVVTALLLLANRIGAHAAAASPPAPGTAPMRSKLRTAGAAR